MIAVNQITVQYGDFVLFDDISFMVNERDRIGLVGKNGAGKSTLLKIFVKEISPTAGEVEVPSDTTLGYLPQEMTVSDTRTVFEETIATFEEVLKIQERIAQINKQLSQRTDYESEEYLALIQKLTEANERFDIVGGATIDAEVEQTLLGLGFERTDFERPTAEFSGGWRMRIELAKILLKKPDVFLLDEPTNHLDIESIQWLEDFLRDYQGAVILISHDRAFLDNVTNRTVELSLGKLYDYKVSYSQYVKLRKERRQQQIAAYQNQQKMIEDTERFIERFRYKATKAVQVQSRIKHLEKLDRIEIEEEDKSQINVKFPPAPRSGVIVVEARRLSKSYGDLPVLDDINFVIERGEKVAFVGRNGEGKTTLARIIKDEIDYTGMCKTGHNVNIGYFAQNQAQMLNENKTVFETIDDVAVGDMRTKVRDMLGAFLFSGETIEKKVTVLSGGERARLALAKLLLEPYSLLLLDEPTNHLDMKSKEILKQALLQYNGTLIVVSHDRDFLDGLTEKIFEFRNKKIKEHLGGIYNFIRKRKLENLRDIERKEQKAKTEKKQTISENKIIYEERKAFDKKLRKVKNKIDRAEQTIGKLEKEIEKCETIIATPEVISEKGNDFFENYQRLKKELEAEMERWEQLNLDYETLEKERI